MNMRAAGYESKEATLRHSIARRFSLDEIVEAHEAMERGHLDGKALVLPDRS